MQAIAFFFEIQQQLMLIRQMQTITQAAVDAKVAAYAAALQAERVQKQYEFQCSLHRELVQRNGETKR